MTPRLLVLPGLILSVLAALWTASPTASPARGDLQIVIESHDGGPISPGATLELSGPDGRYRSPLSQGEDGRRAVALFWGLPAGSYRWRILPGDREDEWTERRLIVPPGTMNRVVLAGDAPPRSRSLLPVLAQPDDDDAVRDLPGFGTETRERLSTFPDLWSTVSWDGLPLENAARREPIHLALPLAAGVSSRGFPSLAPPAGESGWQLSRGGSIDTRTGIRGVGRLDAFNRKDATGRARLRLRNPLIRDIELVLQAKDDEDAYPRATVDEARPHSGLTGLNLLGTARLLGGRSSWDGWATVAGLSRDQDYLPKGYARDEIHAPREESAFFAGRIGIERELARAEHFDSAEGRGPWRHRFRIEGHHTRIFREIGDGLHFDVLPGYGRPDGNGNAVDGGTQWRGDDARTGADEGHVYDHYLLTVTKSSGATAAWETVPTRSSRLRADIDLTFHAVRHYEHFEPTQTFRDLEGGGYFAVRRIGYSEDGLDHEPGSQIEVPQVKASLSWDAVGRTGAWRASLYALLFKSNQEGPSSWDDLPDPNVDDEIFQAQLEDPGWKGGVGGSLGHAVLLGESTVWAEARRIVRRPPLLALGLDPVFMQRSLFLGTAWAPFGNPHLGPESESWLQVGVRFRVERSRIPLLSRLLRLLGGGRHLYVQTGVYGAWTSDAWVQKVTPEDQGSLEWIDDSGRRRLRGLHVDLRSAPTPPETGPWIAASYDASRLEFEGGGPLGLDALWREPDLPVQSWHARETGDAFRTPLDAFVDDEFVPHSLDRTHRLSAAVVYRTAEQPGALAPLWSGWALGALFRWESGRPYTPIATVSEGLVGSSALEIFAGEAHSGRLADTYRLDVSATRRWRFLDRELMLKLEVLNVFDRENEIRAYRATGEPDDDGFLNTAEGGEMADAQGPSFPRFYRIALEDAFNYDIPRIFRVSAEITLSRMPLVGSPGM